MSLLHLVDRAELAVTCPKSPDIAVKLMNDLSQCRAVMRIQHELERMLPDQVSADVSVKTYAEDIC